MSVESDKDAEGAALVFACLVVSIIFGSGVGMITHNDGWGFVGGAVWFVLLMFLSVIAVRTSRRYKEKADHGTQRTDRA